MKILNLVFLIIALTISGNAAQIKSKQKAPVKQTVQKKAVETKIVKKEEKVIDTRREYTGEPIKKHEKLLEGAPIETDDRAAHFKYFQEHKVQQPPHK